MAGFPIRPSRAAFGPKKENELGQGKPTKSLHAEEWNLSAWQVAGLGVTGVLAWALVQGSDGARLASAEAWNPDGAAPLRPTFARSSTGIYTLTFAAQYPDEEGTLRDLTLLGGNVTVQSSTANLGGVVSRVGNVLTVKISAGATGTLTDANFLIEVR